MELESLRRETEQLKGVLVARGGPELVDESAPLACLSGIVTAPSLHHHRTITAPSLHHVHRRSVVNVRQQHVRQAGVLSLREAARACSARMTANASYVMRGRVINVG